MGRCIFSVVISHSGLGSLSLLDIHSCQLAVFRLLGIILDGRLQLGWFLAGASMVRGERQIHIEVV